MTGPVTSGVAETDGAALWFDRRGSGPALLLISGGGGDAARYARTADALAASYTVLTYDRRGCARSRLTSGPAATLQMDHQSRDARAVIESNGLRTAAVFGNSGGALIGLDMAARFPSLVTALVAHEPPAISVLPDAGQLGAAFDRIEQTLDQGGWQTAALHFLALNDQLPANKALRTARWFSLALRLGSPDDLAFFLRHEMRSFVEYDIDFGRIAAGQVPVTLAGGEQSRQQYTYRAAQVIAAKTGRPFAEFPGDHTGFLKQPQAFASRLAEILTGLEGSRL